MKKYILFLVFLLVFLNIKIAYAAVHPKRVAFYAYELNKQDYNLKFSDGFIKTLAANPKYKKIQYNNINTAVPLVKFDTSPVTNPDLIIDIYNAASNTDLFEKMIQDIKVKKYDAILAISTKEAQTVKSKNINDVPVVFSAGKPVEAGLVKNVIAPEANFTGASGGILLDVKLQKLKDTVPGLKKLGFVYHINDASQKILVDEMIVKAAKFGFTLVSEPVDVIGTASVEEKKVKLNAATKAVINQKVDAIFFGSGTLMSTDIMKAPFALAAANKVPALCNDIPTIEYGALIAVNSNVTQVGVETCIILDKVLSGTPVNKIPVYFLPNPEIVLNLSTAKKIGLDLSDDILFQATRVIE